MQKQQLQHHENIIAPQPSAAQKNNQNETKQIKIETQIKNKTKQPIQVKNNNEKLQGRGSNKYNNLQSKFQTFTKKIQVMISQINKNTRHVEIFFNKSGTNHEEIIQNLRKLQIGLLNIKQQLKKQGINLIILQKTIDFLIQYLGKDKFEDLLHYQKAIIAMDLDAKVTCCFQLLQGSLKLPLDITTEPKQKYKNVWKRIKTGVLQKKQKVQQGLQFMKRMMGITTSAVINEQQEKGAFTKAFAFGLSYPQYFFSNAQSRLRSMMFYRKPTIQMAQKIWDLPQNGMISQFAKLGMKSIKTKFKIYIPTYQIKQQGLIEILQPKLDSIKVRVLHNHNNIYLKNKDEQKKSKFKFGFCCGDNSEVVDQITSVVLHIHGGGFVALSSRSMQSYTRRWARQLNIPIFSIDYRKPPFHRFPTAAYDCLRLYQFLTMHIHKYLNIKPKKIILAGDSAGGNLACSLMGLILKNKLPPPYGIFVAYPACDLRRIFSPSRIYSFQDPLLNPPMLMLCLREYLNNKNEHQLDPLASPILLTEEYVNGTKDDTRFPVNWPKTIVQVGAKDPLFDDSLRLMQKMVSSNIDCECQVYQNLSHGFLNLDFAISECSKTIEDSIIHLKKLLQ